MTLHRTNINLYAEDVEFLKRHYGWGWSERVRDLVCEHVTACRQIGETYKLEEEPFGRQPQPVLIIAQGDLRDVDYFLNRIKSLLESSTYANVERMGNQLQIYPGAVNE